MTISTTVYKITNSLSHYYTPDEMRCPCQQLIDWGIPMVQPPSECLYNSTGDGFVPTEFREK